MKIKNLLFILLIVTIGFIGINNVSADSTVLYNDGTLIINEKSVDRSINTNTHGNVIKTYEIYDSTNPNSYVFADETEVLWSNEANDITRIEIGQAIQPTSTAYWFYGTANIASADFTKLNTSHVTDMQYMFYNATSGLNSFRSSDYVGISDFDTSQVIDMNHMFAGFYDVGFSLNNWNTSKVTNMSYMFYNNKFIEDLDLSNWNVSNVTNMNGMFQKSNNGDVKINVSGWDTTQVTDMSYMFAEAKYNNTKKANIKLQGTLKIPNNCDVEKFGYDSNFYGKILISGNVINYSQMFSGENSQIGLYYNNNTGSNMIDSIILELNDVKDIMKNPHTVTILSSQMKFENLNTLDNKNAIASQGTTVKLVPTSSYLIKTISIKNANGEEVTEYDYNTNTFIMPNCDVTISGEFIHKQPSITNLSFKIEDYVNATFSWGFGGVGNNSSDYDYEIYMKKVSDPDYEYLGKTNDITYTINNLTQSEQYVFKLLVTVTIRGERSVLVTKESNILTVPAPLTGNLNVTSQLIYYNKIRINWDTISGANGYYIYCKTKAQNDYTRYKTVDLSTSTTDLIVDYNTEYDCKVVPYVEYYHGNPSKYYGIDMDGITSISTKPEPPMNIGNITIDSYNYNNTKFSWIGNEGIDYYKIYYKTSEEGEYNHIDTTSNTYYQTNNLLPMQKYFFRIESYVILNNQLFMDNSVEFDITTVLPPSDELTLSINNMANINVSWSKVDAADGYYIYYKSTASENFITAGTTTDLNYRIENLNLGTEYNVKVSPYVLIDGHKQVSNTYILKSIKTDELNAPTTLVAKLKTYNSVSISWSKVANADGYYVFYRLPGSNFTLLTSTTKLSTTKAKLLAGKNYVFAIMPYVLVNGEKVTSGSYISKNIYTLKKMASPTLSKYSGKVKVKWTKINGASGYQILRSTSKTGTYTVVKTVNSSYSSAKITATKNKKYYYKVRAYKIVNGKKILAPSSGYRSYILK